MSITIHYSGIFRIGASLNEMIEDATAFARLNNWKFEVFESSFDGVEPAESGISELRYGLNIIPPLCESVHLYFNSERQLGFYHEVEGVISEAWIGDEATGEGMWVPEVKDEHYKPHWGAFTKTASAGKRVHMKIVELLKRLSVKYFTDFRVVDKSGYWDHENAQLLDWVFEDEDMQQSRN